MSQRLSKPVLLCLAATAAASLAAASVPSSRDARSEGVRLRGRFPSHRLVTASTRWCGSGEVPTDRAPDAAAGNQIHVVYAYPSDGTDGFAAKSGLIVSDIASVDAWWRVQDSTRAPRYDTYAFEACDSQLGLLDLAAVKLPNTASYYGGEGSDSISKLSTDLSAAPSALGDAAKKYLVYYDGSVADPALCGISYTSAAATGRLGYAVVFLQASCGPDLGAGGLAAGTAAHELTHDLGAVPSAAPHTCTTSTGHVCDSPQDLMYPFISPLTSAILDLNRDDYYGHSSSWWDVQDSTFLSHLDGTQFALSVTVAGTSGTGRVKSDLPGIDCPTACSASFDQGKVLKLTATPAAGSVFGGWTGACSGADTCTVTMDAAKSATATFGKAVTLDVSISGAGGTGSIIANGKTCSVASCRLDVVDGAPVTLRALPASRSRFVSWSGACSGATTCTLLPAAGMAVGALFGPDAYNLSLSVSGRGTVRSIPVRLGCRARCAPSINAGTTIALLPVPDRGWRFAGYRGDCGGLTSCILRMDGDHSVELRFLRPRAPRRSPHY